MNDGDGDDPLRAPDGTLWLHFPEFGEWHGWQPGEDGLFVVTEEEFAQLGAQVLQESAPQS